MWMHGPQLPQTLVSEFEFAIIDDHVTETT
jgi:hypothetical protein